MVVPDANPSRHVAFLKQSCGFSTQARNGTCCRRATRTTKLCIGGFPLCAAVRFFGAWWRVFSTRLPVEGHRTKKKSSSTQPSFLPRGGGLENGGKRAGKR